MPVVALIRSAKPKTIPGRDRCSRGESNRMRALYRARRSPYRYRLATIALGLASTWIATTGQAQDATVADFIAGPIVPEPAVRASSIDDGARGGISAELASGATLTGVGALSLA